MKKVVDNQEEKSLWSAIEESAKRILRSLEGYEYMDPKKHDLILLARHHAGKIIGITRELQK